MVLACNDIRTKLRHYYLNEIANTKNIIVPVLTYIRSFIYDTDFFIYLFKLQELYPCILVSAMYLVDTRYIAVLDPFAHCTESKQS